MRIANGAAAVAGCRVAMELSPGGSVFKQRSHTHTHPHTHSRVKHTKTPTHDCYRERRRWERPASTHTTSGKGLYPRERPLFNINRIGRPGGLNQLTSAVVEVRGGTYNAYCFCVCVCVVACTRHNMFTGLAPDGNRTQCGGGAGKGRVSRCSEVVCHQSPKANSPRAENKTIYK